MTHKSQIELDFITAFNAVQTAAHENAVEKGWWDDDRGEGECIALIHSELSEVLEGLRNGNPDDKHCPNFKNVEVEYADVIIRIMDNAQKRGYNVAEALLAKMQYNVGRAFKHGGKLF